MNLVSCFAPLHPTISDRTRHSHPVYGHREVHSAAQVSSQWYFRDQCHVLPIELAYSPALPPPPLTVGFCSVLLASPSVLSSGDLFGFMTIGVLKAKVPVEEEGVEIAQTTVQSLVCLPWVECPRQESEGKVGVRVLLGWRDPD